MLRHFVSAATLACVLAASHPAFADTLASTASEQSKVAQGAEPAMVLPGPLAPTVWLSPDAPAGAAHRKDIVLIGFGCG